MPGPITATRAARAAQVARDQQAAQRLTSAYLDTWARIKANLATLQSEIATAQASGTKVPTSWLYQQNRLATLQKQVAREVAYYAQYAHQTVRQEILTAAHQGASDAVDSLNSTIPAGISYSFNQLPTKAVNTLVSNVDNGRLEKLFGQFAPDAALKAKQALITGVAVGDSPAQLAARLRDSLSVPLSRAMTIARTESLTAYNQANVSTYKANADVLDGWKWLTGDNPCPECADNAGQLFSLDDDPPPLHPNCRCVASPVTKSWSEILGGSGDDSGD